MYSFSASKICVWRTQKCVPHLTVTNHKSQNLQLRHTNTNEIWECSTDSLMAPQVFLHRLIRAMAKRVRFIWMQIMVSPRPIRISQQLAHQILVWSRVQRMEKRMLVASNSSIGMMNSMLRSPRVRTMRKAMMRNMHLHEFSICCLSNCTKCIIPSDINQIVSFVCTTFQASCSITTHIVTISKSKNVIIQTGTIQSHMCVRSSSPSLSPHISRVIRYLPGEQICSLIAPHYNPFIGPILV